MASHTELLTGGTLPNPLENDGWISWNEQRWGLTAERVRYSLAGKATPVLEGVLYLDKKGKVRMPPLNPFLPFRLIGSATRRPQRLYSQWTVIARLLALDLCQRGMVGRIVMPPGLIDARPFQWLGMIASVRYTFMAPLPVDMAAVDGSVRTNIRKASDVGITASESNDWDSILNCLLETEDRSAFSHRLDSAALAEAASSLGSATFRGYLARDSFGAPVSGGIRLLAPDGMALDWVQGTTKRYLRSGVGQLVESVALSDLARAGGRIFDFGGANIESVARAKADWGFSLVPYVVLTEANWRNLAVGAASIVGSYRKSNR